MTQMNWSSDLPKIAEALGADAILRDGKIITVDENDTIADALAIKYGRIAYVGTNEDVEALIGKHTNMIALGGRCVTPGLITTHEHFLRYGLNALYGIDLWYPKVDRLTGQVKTIIPTPLILEADQA